MHTLTRQIRFSLDPFADRQIQGSNGYASKPCVGGFGLYFSLWIDLASPLDPETGFVVNVSQIDMVVRQDVIPLFEKKVCQAFRAGRIPTLISLVHILKQSWRTLNDSFRPKVMTQLSLELNPFRRITIQSDEANMFIVSEKFEFSAMHQLWNEAFDEKRNFELFGKCANPNGHGHNYVLEVSVERATDSGEDTWHAEFERVVKEQFLDQVDHKNLNIDVAELKSLNPTVENLSSMAWKKLNNRLGPVKLCNVTVWENDRTYCSYKE